MRQYHFAIGFDQHYLTPFYALMASLQHHHPAGSVCVHAMVSGLTPQQQADIEAFLAGRGNQIRYYTADENLVRQFVLLNNWTGAVYYRLFLPLLVPADVDRLLYLDTDIIVVDNLAPLWEVPLNGAAVGAVADNYVKTQPLLGIHEDGEYFNSGVLLIDVGQWKRQDITAQAVAYLHNYPERIRFVDQCALNAILHRRWQVLPWSFNVIYSRVPQDVSLRWLKQEFLPGKFIIHYTLQRPWQMLNRNRLSYLYRHYLRQSPHGRRQRVITDFRLSAVLPWLRLRILYLYFDMPWLGRWWRAVKQFISPARSA